ncbi:unnamed protein product [Rangifer tarandus platyrhynchus]|uniref:Uncharacterized protein n=1 Tax=Rangifer tarandus platyrhynchus TaxID=3082113 RepID=A0AC59YJZ4_RANTA
MPPESQASDTWVGPRAPGSPASCPFYRVLTSAGLAPAGSRRVLGPGPVTSTSGDAKRFLVTEAATNRALTPPWARGSWAALGCFPRHRTPSAKSSRAEVPSPPGLRPRVRPSPTQDPFPRADRPVARKPRGADQLEAPAHQAAR